MTCGSDSQQVFTERGQRDLQVLGRLDFTCCHRAAMKAAIMLQSCCSVCMHTFHPGLSHSAQTLQSTPITNVNK